MDLPSILIMIFKQKTFERYALNAYVDSHFIGRSIFDLCLIKINAKANIRKIATMLYANIDGFKLVAFFKSIFCEDKS